MLRMDDLPGEALRPLEGRRVTVVVAVVARARQQEAARHPDRLARLAPVDVEGPAAIRRRPLGRDHPLVEAHPLGDPVVARRIPDVAEDRRPVGDRAAVLPRTEGVAERVHVGIRPDTRIPEEVPRPADTVPRLEDRVRLPRAVRLEVIGRPDPREPGPDDHDVKVLELHPPEAIQQAPLTVLISDC